MFKITLKILILLLVLTESTMAEGDTSLTPYYIFNAASQFKIDETLLYSICTVESRCRSNVINHDDARKIEKEKGIIKKSFGLFQIQAETAEFLGFNRYEIKTVDYTTKKGKHKTKIKKIDHILDLLKPETNSWYAAKYLNYLYGLYKDTPRVISAYNAGHPIQSNEEYVLKVLSTFAKLKIDSKR